ncbi:MAG: hypothetical protein II981_05905 [Bacteroidales bacterium]|nr:hypothetical protein [Bacteroidales bacterium]
MDEKQITYRFTDTGHWLARCDHSTNEIELNRREFFKLSPMYQEYVWIHECVHLLYNVQDEAECNRITDEIFLSKAKSEKERLERVRFVASSNDYGKSNIVISGAAVLIGTLVSAVVGAGVKLGTAANNKRNSGYYSLSEADQNLLVDGFLAEAFEESLYTDTQSARDIFWSKMQPYIARKKEQSYAGWYSNNSSVVRPLITKYEEQYGFGFSDITPVRRNSGKGGGKTVVIAASVAVAVLILLIVLIKTKKK